MPVPDQPVTLNDLHSRLNATRVRTLLEPTSTAEVVGAVRAARDRCLPVSVCGGRHAMGGQQFGADAVQLDLSRLTGVHSFDPERRLLTVGAGIQWPALVAELERRSAGLETPLTFRQKQTGADRLSLGGALSANVHGRGLRFRPFVDDVESFVLVDADGEVRHCSREEDHDLFALAIGGYGLFGVITEVTLRLVPRQHLRRDVEVVDLQEIESSFEERLGRGYTYGDFQFMTDPAAPGFLDRGVLAAYAPVPDDVPLTADPRELTAQRWQQLLTLAHTDKARAFDLYSEHYLGTDGQVYRSDRQQLGVYVDGYHDSLDGPPASEMITEVYVPRTELGSFMRACREDFRAHEVECIYGTVRLIEPDEESFLPWAQGLRACIIVNLHVQHDEAGITKAADDFRRIIDRALERGGSFYLTYHRWATREQLLAAHPRLPAFLEKKHEHDPDDVFTSEWYRHLRRTLAG
ncbi:FAD-binding oxidoreductase [Serinicoccus marinus]|uniref:FAD-binding oxidoreductase n=1 Tax=Serinicoccus marinus TaxID=247333 RepID=UPI0003B6744E|nr:FAD-binding oxidoreductase [Serinicoccus marinus]